VFVRTPQAIRLLILLCLLLSTRVFAGGYSLRFYGNGTGDIDRVKIPVNNPETPADIGETDITIEFWMKALPGENSAAGCQRINDGWITGNIMFDRDVFGDGDFGDYGISLFTSGNAGIAFGVHNGTSGDGICSTTNVADGQWHHVAVTRSISDGMMRIFVDGVLEDEKDGPDGDISYNDARPASAPNDPYLVIGAEKHDAGPQFPSFSGWIDEVRLSTTIRYTSNFSRPNQPFSSDANTAALYHFDEGTGDLIVDSASGGASDGIRNFGGNPAGPVWSADKAPLGPFSFSSNSFPILISGLTNPVALTHAGDGTGRLFITEQSGFIRLWDGSTLSEFLNITGIVRDDGNEEGLLSVAFHPDYEINGFFYVYYTNSNGDNVVARYTVSADPDDGDEGTGQIILTIPHPGQTNHNGGQLQFGPEGYLYIGTGDGGGFDDPNDNAENINVLLGKMLRIDISVLPYDTPSDNPYDGDATPGLDEIWAIGLRNPWRYSFDRITHDLFIGDVGQNQWEEIDFEAHGTLGGTHWGWDTMEGFHCHEPPTNCDMTGKKLPILEYSHGVGQSITGGYRYRGFQFPQMNGRYVYADYFGGLFWGVQSGTGNWTSQSFTANYFISAFGETENGDLYLVDHDAGAIRRILGTNANISVSISDSPDPVFLGNNLTYTIVVANAGPNQATGVTLIDELPPDVNFVSASGGCTHNSGIVRCSPGTINSGANATIQIVVTPTAPGTITNYAIASANQNDQTPVNNSDSENTTVNELTGADLSVTKTDSADPVDTGTGFTYTINAANAGPDDATGVVVTDTLPGTVAFVSASAGCSHSAGTVTCSIGNLNSGANTSATITVTPLAAGILTNNVTIAGAEQDPVPGNNNDSETTNIVDPQTCLLCDEFDDDILNDQWTYVKPSWQETGGSLIGTPDGRKAEAIASPLFTGCSSCSIETTVQTAGGDFGRVWALGWYVDKRNLVELLMKEPSDIWILKQRINKAIVAKAKIKRTIDPNVTYTVRMTFNGTNFEVFFDGESTPSITVPAVGTPSGTIGYRIKNTTGTIGRIEVN
jgi:uncharacterized repeat protein (TIGR01451 family)